MHACAWIERAFVEPAGMPVAPVRTPATARSRRARPVIGRPRAHGGGRIASS
ncbi:hypothetical protein BURPSS13_P0708 [Burkholderia pseudomallei S13]|nr:hypothetical protein BURPSS13_P0708 [Burkholderia pseudomallei S13]